MRIAYLDCFSGISGDMFLGALVDAGVPPKVFEQAVESLGIGARLQVSQVNRSGIAAVKVDVLGTSGAETRGRAGTRESAPHEPSAKPAHSHAHERGLAAIREIIRTAKVSDSAKQTAISIFERLGWAEAKVHDLPIDKIHFHEVGAVDAIADIVCSAVGAEALAVDEFVCSPLNVGGGTVECAHGTLPVPAPATVELLKGAPVYSSGIEAELVTPTGAAIVTTLVSRFAAFPAMKIERSGYGAGSRDLKEQANVLRITIGEELAASAGEDARAKQFEAIAVLEANLDDLNPQVFGYVMDRLFEAGALDVFGTPVQMKKSRPGTLLTVLAKPEDADRLSQIIFAETTTLGIRRREEQRQALARKWERVSTRFGDVRIKVASLNGTVSSYAPEYEDCRRIASEHRVPLKTVMQEAVQEYLKSSRQRTSRTRKTIWES